MYSSSSELGSMEASVAVFEMEASTPPIRTRFPPATSSAGMKYLSREPVMNNDLGAEDQFITLLERSTDPPRLP